MLFGLILMSICRPVHLILSGLILSLLSACAISQGPEASPTASRAEILIERLAENSWQIDVQLDQPATILAFVRTGEDVRVAHWEIGTPGIELRRENDIDILVSETPFQAVRFLRNTEDLLRTDDYTPFTRFADGSMAVYTHQFQLSVVPEMADLLVASPEFPSLAPSFRFRDQLTGQVRTAGRRVRDDERISFNEEIGGYALFGSVPPISDIQGGVYVSEELPQHLTDLLLRAIPQSLAYMETEFDTPLRHPPMIILTRRPNVGQGISFRGGVVDGQVVMQIGGDAVDSDDAGVRSQVRTMAAGGIVHEMAHLWNVGLVLSPNPEEAWIHEGGADAISWRVLTEIFDLSSGYMNRQHADALNHCASALASGSFYTAIEGGNYRAHYSCGATIMLAIERDLQTEGGDNTLLRIWSNVIQHALATDDHSYSQSAFLDAFHQQGGQSAILDWVNALISEPVEDPREILIEGLALAGIAVEIDEDELVFVGEQ
jgi:hypothetical protein